MLSFELVGGVTAARHFVEAVDIITLAESHGGIETLRGRKPVQVISLLINTERLFDTRKRLIA